ncbi:MAG: hypothetical protein JXR35_02455 [Rhodobacteraceae bacterium]|nr:hypothetical protein [Paracoccaceae bacterium]
MVFPQLLIGHSGSFAADVSPENINLTRSVIRFCVGFAPDRDTRRSQAHDPYERHVKVV